MKYKVRITKAPTTKMAYGGQDKGLGLDLGKRVYDDSAENPYASVSNTLQAVPRDQANIEAEKGETAYGDMDQDGRMEHFKIGGKRHTQGGTPLNVPEGTFIYSDTKKMAIGGPTLQRFGKSAGSKRKYTPAELAKQYDINKYKAIIEDPKTDPVKRKTAQMMIENYQRKLAELAIVQESMKGFPQGIPDVAKPLMDQMMQQEQQLATGEEQPEMRYGGGLPKYQTKGQVKTGSIYDPELQSFIKSRQENPLMEVGLSPRMMAGDNTLPLLQSRTSTGLYGDVQSSEIDELKKRHSWYFDGKTNFDFKNKADVTDFQKSYNELYNNLYGVNYFAGDNKYDAIDGMLGEYTYNAPALQRKLVTLDFKPKIGTDWKPHGNVVNTKLPQLNRIPSTDTIPTTNTSGIKPGDGTPVKNTIPFEYTTPDKLSMYNALANRADIKKYLPYQATMNMQAPTPTFFDPNRELAANAEMANQERMYAAMFAGPQSMSSINSATSGQGAQRAADILGRYNNMNVQVANQAAAQQADIMNRQSAYNAERATSLYDKTMIANQQYDNAKRAANADMLKSYINAWKNRSALSLVNNTSSTNYMIDPRTGAFVLRKGYQPGATPSGATAGAKSGYGLEDYASLVSYLKQKGWGDKAEEQATKMINASMNNKGTDTDMDGMADRQSFNLLQSLFKNQ